MRDTLAEARRKAGSELARAARAFVDADARQISLELQKASDDLVTAAFEFDRAQAAPAAGNRIGRALGVNPWLNGARFGGLVYSIAVRWQDPRARRTPYLPACYAFADRVLDRHAAIFAVRPLHLLYRVRRAYNDLRWNVYAWLVDEGFLKEPYECCYLHELRVAWPQNWSLK